MLKMCTIRRVIFLFIIVFGIVSIYLQYQIRWSYFNFIIAGRISKDDQENKCDVNGSHRTYVINIFLGRNFINNINDAKDGTVTSLLISLKDAKKYYLKSSDGNMCIDRCNFFVDNDAIASSGSKLHKNKLTTFVRKLNLCNTHEFIHYNGRVSLPQKKWTKRSSSTGKDEQQWKKQMVLRLKDMYCYFTKIFWARYELDYVLTGDKQPAVLFIEDDVVVAPDAFNILHYLLDIRNSIQKLGENHHPKKNFFIPTSIQPYTDQFDLISLSSWGSENNINANESTVIAKKMFDFPTLGYSYSYHFYHSKIKPIIEKVRKSKTNVEWNDALHKHLLNQIYGKSLICLQPTLSRLHHIGFKSLLGNIHHRWMRHDPPWHSSSTSSSSRKLFKKDGKFFLQPFLRNVLGIPCSNDKYNVLEMIRSINPNAGRKLELLCNQPTTFDAITYKEINHLKTYCPLMKRKGISPTTSALGCHYRFDALFPLEERFNILTWDNVVRNLQV
jgi:hypothetical protein